MSDQTAAVIRRPLPGAYLDAAFVRCLHEGIRNTQLTSQFERLTGLRLASEPGMRKFVEFIHGDCYMRIPDETIQAFRLTAKEPAHV